MSRKEKMKVYHGLPKSPTDEHTIFYADLDGNTNSNIGTVSATSLEYKQSITGYGVITTSPNILPLKSTLNTLTMDFWLIPPTSISVSSGLVYLVKNEPNPSNYNSLGMYITSGGILSVSLYDSSLGFATGSTVRQVIADFISKYGGQNVHLRLTVNPTEMNIYLNGTNVLKEPLTNSGSINFDGILIGSYRGTTSGAISVGGLVTLSDVHISNIDRGDYFPNLPQDFIEGKAIIKERLGQQQIKGDPLISQVTELIVPALTDEIEKISYYDANTSTRYYYNNPELGTGLSDTWGTGGRIIIKGLNNEIISGVIDSDTALAKVVNYVSSSNIIYLSAVSGLAIGDKIRLINDRLMDLGEYTIQNVNTANNTITIDGNVSIDTDVLVVETTTTTSSPIVKTTEGTVVNGTWTGLGTKQATFTLGTNTGLSGKDLVVTYSLNMPQGNSHFPELPSDIERAYTETGIEMKPVSEIVIEDDFRGKIAGSLKECPHMYNWSSDATLLTPTKLEGDTSNIQTYYNKLYSKDNVLESMTVGTLNGIPQQLFSFNILDIIRRKLNNKNITLAWIKSNITKITFNHVGYCTNGTTFDRLFAKYDYTNNKWLYVKTVSTTQSSLYQVVVNPEFYEINNEGIVSFLVYGGASNGSSNSIVFTDYVSIELSIKHDQNYLAFFSDNKRARECPCNPVLIQKETKTVKRYIPSKECFVTESLTYKNNVVESSTSEVVCDKGLLKSPNIYITNYGTSNFVDSSYTLGLQPLIPRLPLNPNYKPYQFSLGEMPIKSLEGLPNRDKVFLAKLNSIIDALPNSTNQNKFYSEGKIRDVGEQLSDNYPMALRFGVGLVAKNNEIYMKVRSCVPNSVNYSKSSILSMSTAFDMEYLYKLPNRPLIK